MKRMTKEEIKSRFPNDEDLAYGFDGTDRYGRTYYGKGLRCAFGPTPSTGLCFTTGFNDIGLSGVLVHGAGSWGTGGCVVTFPRPTSTGGKNHTPLPFPIRGGKPDEVLNLWPTRGGNGEHEVINYFELTCSGSPDGKPLHPFVDPSSHHEPLSYD